MKWDFKIKEVSKNDAGLLIQEFHYSPVMPRLTKHFLGCFLEDRMVGVITLGWGTQPLQTIRKLFPELVTKDYFEIGKMCMHPDMPRNSESQMLSKTFQWIRENRPSVQFLYTWADGIVGKAGYVYQSANFLYGGFIWTDVYISNKGEKIHPRSTKELCRENAALLGKEKVFWLTKDFLKIKNISRVRGKQFRYIYPLTKNAKKHLLKRSTVMWNQPYPKDKDLEWKIQTDNGFVQTPKPEFNMSVVEHNKKNVSQIKKNNINEFFEY